LPQSSVLLLSSRYGEGHFKTGEALVDRFEKQTLTQISVQHLDFGSFFYKKTDFLLRTAYFNMIRKTPGIWRRLFEKTENFMLEKYPDFILNLGTRNLLSFIFKSRPDIIVSTHFMPASILAAMKKSGMFNIPLVTIVTDYFVHGVWINSGTDLYVVGCKEVAARLIKAGVNPSRIIATGIPVRACFEANIPKGAARVKLGLEPDKTTVLIMGGSCDSIKKESEIFEALIGLSELGSVQFLIICGSDKKSYQILKTKKQNRHIKAKLFGYVDNVQEFMAASDLLITKGGALTISEALTIGLPVIMYKPIPGHEYGNAVFVESNGAGIMVNSPKDLLKLVAYLLQDQSKLKEMSLAAKKMLPAHSAENAVKAILGLAIQKNDGFHTPVSLIL